MKKNDAVRLTVLNRSPVVHTVLRYRNKFPSNIGLTSQGDCGIGYLKQIKSFLRIVFENIIQIEYIKAEGRSNQKSIFCALSQNYQHFFEK